MIDEVMKRHKGKWPGPQEFIKTMASLKLEAVRGPVHFDDMRNPVQNIYIKKVEKKKMFGYPQDELWNTVTKTYPDVGQFWKYDKKEYLKTPLYSRDFPPCKHCN
jgi:branched-chain amino acid transport system substrate-binding protein